MKKRQSTIGLLPNPHLRILRKCGCIVTNGHFVLRDRTHSQEYVNKDALYPHTSATAHVCVGLAQSFAGDNVEVVIGPSMGGIILAHGVADYLTGIRRKEVLGLYAEKVPNSGEFVIRRGYDALLEGKRVLVVEDVAHTGETVRRVIDSVLRHGGKVVGVGLLCLRGKLKPKELGVRKLKALTVLDAPSFDEGNCPLCQTGVPINTDLGHGAEYVARKT